MESGLGVFGIFFFWALLIIIPLGGFVISLWALIDGFSQPEWAWKAAGENREMYLVLEGLALVACQPLGWIIGLMYFLGARKRVEAAAALGPTPGVWSYGYGPQPGYGPPPGYGQPQGYGQPAGYGPQPGQAYGSPPAGDPHGVPGQPGQSTSTSPAAPPTPFEPPRYDVPGGPSGDGTVGGPLS